MACPGCSWWTSDAHAGLKAAVAQQFTNASWQRCRVHFMRNLHGAVSAKQAPVVTAAVKTIFAHTEPDDIDAQWDQVKDTLEPSFPKVATMMRDGKADVGVHRVSRRTGRRSGPTTRSSG